MLQSGFTIFFSFVMCVFYKNIAEKILKELNSNELVSPIVILNGPPGCGKSEVIKYVNNDISERQKKTTKPEELKSSAISATINITSENDDKNAIFAVDLFHFTKINVFSTKNKKNSSNELFSSLDLNEAEYNYEQFNNEFDRLIENNSEIAEYYRDIFRYNSFGYRKENNIFIQEKLPLVKEYVKENYTKKSIQRLLLTPDKVSTESLIVDLMNIFYPEITSGSIEGIRPTEKVKILITFDNCDFINESINILLFDNLFEYAYNTNFNEFTSYNISFTDPTIKVSDFFDFRFIYSVRSSISRYIQKQKPQFIDKIKHIELKYFSEKDLAEIIPLVPSGYSANEFLKDTHGIQKLIYSDIKSIDTKSPNIKKELTKRAYNILKGNLSKKQENMLHCLAFGYDENALFNKKCNEIYSFDSSCYNLLRYNLYLTKGTQELGLTEENKSFIKDYLKENYPDDYSNFNNLYNACKLIPDIVDKFNDEEFSLIVALSFIPKENNLELTRLSMYKRLGEIDEFYLKHRYLFPNEKYYIDKNISDKIKNYVSQSDPNFYAELINVPNKYGNRIEEEKQRIVNQKTAQILSYEKEMKNIDLKYSSESNSYKKHQEIMMEYENQMIKVRQKINDKSFYNNFLVSMISTFITLTILIFAIVLPNIFIADGPNSPVFSIQFILYALVVVLAILDYIFIKRTILSYKNKDKNKEYKQQLENLEIEKNSYIEKMSQCKEKMEIFENRKRELNKLINS